jgi:hypothetical protein
LGIVQGRRITHAKIQNSETTDAAVNQLLAAVGYHRSLGEGVEIDGR